MKFTILLFCAHTHTHTSSVWYMLHKEILSQDLVATYMNTNCKKMRIYMCLGISLLVKISVQNRKKGIKRKVSLCASMCSIPIEKKAITRAHGIRTQLLPTTYIHSVFSMVVLSQAAAALCIYRIYHRSRHRSCWHSHTTYLGWMEICAFNINLTLDI